MALLFPSIAFSAASDKTVKIWDIENGKLLRTLEGHSSAVRCVRVSPGGRDAVSVSDDHMLNWWDLDDYESVDTFHFDAQPVCCAFADEMNLVAGDLTGRVHFFTLEGRDLDYYWPSP
jgi:WD40 repeat protein